MATLMAAPIYPGAFSDSEAEPYMHELMMVESHSNGVLETAVDPDDLEKRLEEEAARIKAEKKAAKKKAKHELSSGPPSPPESEAGSPRVTIKPCPRLTSIPVPPNYGAVEEKKIYRSAFPQERDMVFCKELNVCTTLSLVDTEPTEAYLAWLAEQNIGHKNILIDTNKDGTVINTTMDSLCEAILFCMDSNNYPLYIHCNQGKHRTGCVIACFRKIQRMPIEEILEEYHVYANPKPRAGDIALIKSFDPDMVFEYAEKHGYLKFARRDSTICDIDGLRAAMAAGAAKETGGSDVEMSSVEGVSYSDILAVMSSPFAGAEEGPEASGAASGDSTSD